MQLQSLSHERRVKLEDLHKLYEVLGECDDLEEQLDGIKLGLERDQHLGRHLTECEELSTKHQLVLKTIASHRGDLDRIKAHEKAGEPQVASKIDYLQKYLDDILGMGDDRSKRLEQSRMLHKFIEDVNDHDAFIREQNTVMAS